MNDRTLHPPESRTPECYACGRVVTSRAFEIVTEDGQRQTVGSDCWHHVHRAGRLGWQPALGGPRLYRPEDRP